MSLQASAMSHGAKTLRIAFLSALTGCVFLVGANTALAAGESTVNVSPGAYPNEPSTVSVTGSAANNYFIVHDKHDPTNRYISYKIQDRWRNPISTGLGCKRKTETRPWDVVCTLGLYEAPARIRVSTADGDDRVTMTAVKKIAPAPADTWDVVSGIPYGILNNTMPVVIDGGNGNDMLAGPRKDVATAAFGGWGSDSIRTGDGRDFLYQNGLFALPTDQSGGPISGGNGSDVLWGSSGNDSIFGEGGGDSIAGQSGYSTSDSGNDTIVGGSGSDQVSSDDGDDLILVLDHTQDTVDCGLGQDTVLKDYDLDVLSACEFF